MKMIDGWGEWHVPDRQPLPLVVDDLQGDMFAPLPSSSLAAPYVPLPDDDPRVVAAVQRWCPPPLPVPTLEELRDMLRGWAGVHGFSATVEILRRYGGGTVDTVPAANRPWLYAELMWK
jgi:hypothetical protein